MLDDVLVKVDFYSKIVIYIYLCILSISTYTHEQIHKISQHVTSHLEKNEGEKGGEKEEEYSSGLLEIECTCISESYWFITDLLLCCYRIWDPPPPPPTKKK